MAEPLTLAAVGAVVLSEGVKFLYGQAGEVLKRWRARKDQTQEDESTPASQTESVPGDTPAILEGKFGTPVIHFDRVPAIETELRELRRSLSDYVDEVEGVDPADGELLARMDSLRLLLEAVYGQRITFKGEQRESSGTQVVVGIAEVKRLAGEAAGVLAGSIEGGEVRGTIEVEEISEGGCGYGVKVDRIGGLPSN